MPGIVRTRVGYAGGAKENPTYSGLGDHSETIQIDYDPGQITYQELLDVFWDSHSPTAHPWSQQYASIIFYHDEEQRRLAEESMARQAESYGRELFTKIVPYTEFYLAEDYHQKYRLQGMPELAQEFRAIYPDELDFTNSTAVARANGYAGGHGSLDALLAEIDALDLPPETKARLLEILSGP